MTSVNGNIFRATGPLWGESTGHRWIPLTKASNAGLWYFFICAWTNGWWNSRYAGDLRPHGAYYDVTITITLKDMDKISRCQTTNKHVKARTVCSNLGALLLTWAKLIPARMSNYIHFKVWGEITYPFQNVNCTAVQILEWISHFIPLLPGMKLFIHVGIKVNPG